MALRIVRYKCDRCGKINRMQFAKGFVAFRRWLMTCRECNKYSVLRAIEGRQLTNQTAWR